MKGSRFYFLAILIIAGCTPPQEKEQSTGRALNTQVKFAKKFAVEENAIIVKEPWPGAVAPISYAPDTPPQRVVVTSTTHLAYLEMLGVEDRIVGFPSTQYITSPVIRKLVNDGKITDLGPDGSMNLELLISLAPDAVFAFDMGSESTTLDKIEESGIPVFYNADFLETSSLGRAEWIKFFGAFFDKEKEADSIFTSIVQRYDSLKALAADAQNQPSIVSGVMYGDTWFLPGGQNWAAEFYRDAGGRYLWKNDSTSGWLEISFESVFEKAGEADFWIGTSTFNTKKELAGQDTRYTHFKAFKVDEVYNYNKRLGPTGGYDFFESAYTRPDRVLADLIFILHPELLPDYDTYYFQKLP